MRQATRHHNACGLQTLLMLSKAGRHSESQACTCKDGSTPKHQTASQDDVATGTNMHTTTQAAAAGSQPPCYPAVPTAASSCFKKMPINLAQAPQTQGPCTRSTQQTASWHLGRTCSLQCRNSTHVLLCKHAMHTPCKHAEEASVHTKDASTDRPTRPAHQLLPYTSCRHRCYWCCCCCYCWSLYRLQLLAPAAAAGAAAAAMPLHSHA